MLFGVSDAFLAHRVSGLPDFSFECISDAYRPQHYHKGEWEVFTKHFFADWFLFCYTYDVDAHLSMGPLNLSFHMQKGCCTGHTIALYHIIHM
jgi:hypothetical protein